MFRRKIKSVLLVLASGAVGFHGAATCSLRDYDHFDFGFFDVFITDDDDFFDVIVDF